MPALQNPDKPAHHIIETREDTVLLNDGTELKRAEKNPWYVLMTIWGEQEGKTVNYDLHLKNRRTWNRWHCGHLSDKDKQALIEKTGFPETDFEALSKEEMAEVASQFQDRLGEGASLPNPDEEVDMSEAGFSKRTVFDSLIFRTKIRFFGAHLFAAARFHRTHFLNGTDFASAQFNALALFDSTEFHSRADFHSAQFQSFARFDFAQFKRGANFTYVQFHAIPWFECAHFNGHTNFDFAQFPLGGRFTLAVFEQGADFSGSEFQRVLWFREATFRRRFPVLDNTLLPDLVVVRAEQDGSIERWGKGSDLIEEHRVFWPDLRAEFGGMNKREKDSARQSLEILRQAMAKQALPEAEHFFYRKEMWILARTGEWRDWLLYRLFEICSDFGYSVKRPIWALVILWAVGVAAFWGHFSSSGHVKPAGPVDAPLFTAIAFSFGNVMPLFGAKAYFFGEGALSLRALPDVLKAWSMAQTIFGFIFLFFLGLGLRTRFRLR